MFGCIPEACDEVEWDQFSRWYLGDIHHHDFSYGRTPDFAVLFDDCTDDDDRIALRHEVFEKFQGNKGRRWRRSQRYKVFAVHTGRLTSRADIDAWCTTVGLPTKAEAEAREAATLAAKAAARAEELRLMGTAADPDDDDPYRGSSVDCTYDKPGDSDDEEEKRELRDRERRRQQEGYVTLALRVQRGVNSTVARGHVSVQLKVTKADYMNFPEQEMEKEMDLRERVAIATGRPWHEAPEDVRMYFALGRHWEADYPDGERRTREQPQEPLGPPPLRGDPQYGLRAGNPEGDEQFRQDRMRWYERYTGNSLEGLSLAEQWQRVHRVARALRADTRDGRAGYSAAMSELFGGAARL